jgi:hypothetical protein
VYTRYGNRLGNIPPGFEWFRTLSPGYDIKEVVPAALAEYKPLLGPDKAHHSLREALHGAVLGAVVSRFWPTRFAILLMHYQSIIGSIALG